VSAARQTVRDLRVVVDDASTDSSGAVIRRCLARLGDARFRHVKLGTNLGQADTLRRATQSRAPGDFARDDE
jgi:glycosyltransferase involved in cell wall biosynthesis